MIKNRAGARPTSAASARPSPTVSGNLQKARPQSSSGLRAASEEGDAPKRHPYKLNYRPSPSLKGTIYSDSKKWMSDQRKQELERIETTYTYPTVPIEHVLDVYPLPDLTSGADSGALRSLRPTDFEDDVDDDDEPLSPAKSSPTRGARSTMFQGSPDKSGARGARSTMLPVASSNRRTTVTVAAAATAVSALQLSASSNRPVSASAKLSSSALEPAPQTQPPAHPHSMIPPAVIESGLYKSLNLSSLSFVDICRQNLTYNTYFKGPAGTGYHAESYGFNRRPTSSVDGAEEVPSNETRTLPFPAPLLNLAPTQMPKPSSRAFVDPASIVGYFDAEARAAKEASKKNSKPRRRSAIASELAIATGLERQSQRGETAGSRDSSTKRGRPATAETPTSRVGSAPSNNGKTSSPGIHGRKTSSLHFDISVLSPGNAATIRRDPKPGNIVANAGAATALSVFLGGKPETVPVKRDVNEVHTDVDLLSAEVEFQRAFILSFRALGVYHPVYKECCGNLSQVYALQHAARSSALAELSGDPTGHVQTVELLVSAADAQRQQERDAASGLKSTSLISHIKYKVSDLAEKARDRLRTRLQLATWKAMENDLAATCGFSRELRTEDVMGEYTAFIGLKDISLLGKNPDAATPEPPPDSADQKMNELLGRRGSIRRRSLPKNKVPVPSSSVLSVAPPIWNRTNRLDVYYGADFHRFETAVESMVRASRKEFGLAAKGASNRLLRGDRDAADEHLLRASLGQLKSYPRMQDFLATVDISSDPEFVIGEFFCVSYKYTNKKDADRLHSPGDWIGIFKLPDYVSADLSNDALAAEVGALVCWCEIPADSNEATLTVDRHMIQAEGLFRALYFVNGSDRPSAGSTNITPHFVKASVVVEGPKHVRDRDKFRVIDDDTVEVVCGVPLTFHVSVGHSSNFLHHKLDTVGFIRDTDEPQKSNCFRILHPPEDSNSGQCCLELGMSLPGTYRGYYFSHECGERICGRSLRIRALRDFGEKEKERAKKISNRQFQVYLSTRWDMTVERAAWKNEIAPRLKRYCDDRFIDFSYVDIASEYSAVSLQTAGAVQNMLRGIKDCSPVFVACMGDMLSLEVHPKVVPKELAGEIMAEFPWVEDVLFGPRVSHISTTEIEFAESVFIPRMNPLPVEASTETPLRYRHVLLRHPSMNSQNFPDHTKNLKGVNTISNIKRMKDDMRSFMGRVSTAKLENNSMSKYASAEEFADTVLPILHGTIDDIFPSVTMPGNLDLIAIETDIGIKQLRRFKASGLDRTAYKPLSAEELDKSGCRIFKPVADNVGHTGLAARTRAVLEGRTLPLSIHDLFAQHVDAVNSDFLLLADSPSSGSTTKVLNFLNGYIRAHDSDFQLPQYGPCLARGVITRYYKHLKTHFGNHTTELLVKVDSTEKSHKSHSHLIARRCLCLYIDIKKPSQRWKLNKLCKYVIDEIRRTFHISEHAPSLDANTYKSLLHWFELMVRSGGDLILILDGIDALDDQKEDDPIFWLPLDCPPSVRILMIGSSVGRLFVNCTSLNNLRDCKVIRRKSQLSEDAKVTLIQAAATYFGFATDIETMGPILSSEKTCSPGYLLALVEELVFRGNFCYAGMYNEEKRWGLWETNPTKALGASPAPPETMAPPDSCGTKATKEKIINVSKELLECDSVKGLMKSRLKRLRATVPFFETAICCIRLSRKGLGQEELKSILSCKNAGHQEFKRNPGGAASFDDHQSAGSIVHSVSSTKEEQLSPSQSRRNSNADIAKSGSREGSPPQSRRNSIADLAPPVISTSAQDAVDASGTVAATAPVTTVQFYFSDWLRLEPALNQVCHNCNGKFTLLNNELYAVLDEIMTEQFNSASVASTAGGASSPSKGAKGVVAPSNNAAKSKTIIKDAWKSPFILMIIDVFTPSLASHRKAQELPFATRYYCKTFDTGKDRKKLAKWKDILLNQVLDIELFCRLNTDLSTDDLLASLKLCNAEPIATAAKLRSNFDSFFGVTKCMDHRKKDPRSSSAGYELLGEEDLEKSDVEGFRLLGSRFLTEMGHFYHNHLHLHVEAQELLESALMMLYCADKYNLSALEGSSPAAMTKQQEDFASTKTTRKTALHNSKQCVEASHWTMHPKSVQCACECLALLGSIYLLRLKAHCVYASMTVLEKRAAVSKRKQESIAARVAAMEEKRAEVEGAGHGAFAALTLNSTKGGKSADANAADDSKHLVIAIDPGDIELAALVEKMEICSAIATRIDKVSFPDEGQLRSINKFFLLHDEFEEARHEFLKEAHHEFPGRSTGK